MPNQSISLQLLKPGQSDPEILYVNASNNKWKSPGAGWLGPQAGMWIQQSDGLHLMDPANEQEVAFCRALVFDTCQTLEHGDSAYRVSGGAGKWQILGIL